MKIISICSGKGGVGKTSVASGIALALAQKGYKVGLIDSDLESSSLADAWSIRGKDLRLQSGFIKPVERDGVKVVSLAMFLDEGFEDAPTLADEKLIHELQDQMIRSIDWGEIDFIILDLPPGCLSPNTVVYTNPGTPKRINEVKPGDKIYAFDGKLELKHHPRRKYEFNGRLISREVIDVVPQGKRPAFKVKTTTREAEATSNHKFLTLTRSSKTGRYWNYSLEWKPLFELQPGDFIMVVKEIPDYIDTVQVLPDIEMPTKYINTYKKVVIPKVITDNFMKLVGYFIGDGSIYSSKGTYEVWFSEPEGGKYREKYITILENTFGCKVWRNKCRFGIHSKLVCQLFQKLGLDQTCLNRRIPYWVYSLPKSLKLSFIEGYCDADGTRRKNTEGKSDGRGTRVGNMEFESSNKNLIDDLRWLCISCGLRVSHIRERTRHNSTTDYLTRIGHKPESYKEKVTTWSFDVVSPVGKRLVRTASGFGKLCRIGGHRNPGNRGVQNEYLGLEPITSIEPIGFTETFDLITDKPFNFVANGIVVHNSGPEIRGITRKVDGIIIVTAAQKMSEMPVRRLVKALKEDYHAPIIGVVENNPYNYRYTEEGTGERISNMYKLPFLASVPWDPDIIKSMDDSVPGYGDNTPSAPSIKVEYFENVVERIEEYFELKEKVEEVEGGKEELKERVVELRKQGASYKSISEQLGIPRSSVFEIVKKAGMTEKRGRRRKKDGRK